MCKIYHDLAKKIPELFKDKVMFIKGSKMSTTTATEKYNWSDSVYFVLVKTLKAHQHEHTAQGDEKKYGNDCRPCI